MSGEDARVAGGLPYELPYEVVDVFTETAYTGNPLAVVLDADGLSTGQLQAIAGEFNLSETAFPLPSGRADYRLRIFTPHTELPFAGHPSVGAAHTLARLGRIRTGAVVQDCGAGLLPLDVDPAGATLTGGQPELGPALDAAALLAAVGLGAGDLDPVAAPGVAGCGISFGYLPVRAAALARAIPDPAALASVAVRSGLSVTAWDGESRVARSRVFAGPVGVGEDPATGSAALGLGVWLVARGLLPGDGTSSYHVRQGAEIGRPSRMDCQVQAAGGLAVGARVRGRVVPVARGRLVVPPPTGP